MNTIDLTAVPILAVAAIVSILFFAAIGVVYIGERIRMGYRGDMRHRREDKPEPVAPAEPVAVPEPAVEAVAEVAVEPEPTPVVEGVVMQGPAPDLLPLATPIFMEVPVGLPQYNSVASKFAWNKVTGSFQEIERELQDGAPLDGSRRNWPLRDPAADAATKLPAKKRSGRKTAVEAGTAVVA